MKRILYIDYLKTIAIFGVIAIHLSSKYITHYTLNASLWFSGLFVESMFRFSIILFVMASGILLIKKNQTIDDIFFERLPLYKKYADITVDTADLSPEETVSRIIFSLKN